MLRIRIRKSQKLKIIRIGCAVLCAVSITLAVFTVPVIAKAIPDKMCGFIAAGVMKDEYRKLLYSFTDRYVRPESYAECVPVSLSAVLGYDYEEETQPVIPDGVEMVSSRNLCGYSGAPEFLVSNQTDYPVDISKIKTDTLPFDLAPQTDTPAVLIIHTHGTESYLPDGVEYYTENDTFRSTDTAVNVVSVGQVIADALNNAGIVTIHDTAMYDEFSYNAAYTNSRAAAKKWLEEYPTIKCIIDVHRDAIVTADGKNIKPLINIGGEEMAQLMLVVGTDNAGADHPDWLVNFTFASVLQQYANDNYAGLMRPLNLRRASFNQQLCSGFFLLEVGSCANTIAEAKRAALLFADVFINTYYK